MTQHHKFNEVKTLVNAKQPVLLIGEKGSGKTTLALQLAEDLKLPFYSISMTRQTTLSHLLGFMNVNGVYIPSQLREAVENGGLMLLDEMDAADANVLLSLNTIENGYVSFPTGIIKLHEDFRLIATANPVDQHSHYTGRVKLDGATLDRFDIIEIDRDENLEKSLVDENTYQHITILREVLKQQNSSIVISMRDSMRYQKRKELKLLDGYVSRLINHNPLVLDAYTKKIQELPSQTDQADCKTLDELLELVEIQSQK
jgi:MoxR-like ATPase